MTKEEFLRLKPGTFIKAELEMKKIIRKYYTKNFLDLCINFPYFVIIECREICFSEYKRLSNILDIMNDAFFEYDDFESIEIISEKEAKLEILSKKIIEL